MGQTRESFLIALREHVGRESPRLIRPRLERFLDEILKESLTPQILENLLREVFTQVLNNFPRKSQLPPGLPAEEPVTNDARTPVPGGPPSTGGNVTELALQGTTRNIQCLSGAWLTDNGQPCHSQTSHPHWQNPEQTGQAGAGPSNLVPAPDGCGPGLHGNVLTDPHRLISFFDSGDFNVEFAG